tara:strand:+ start:228 stop:458 length:231 start_codon:yes stop_codon:yes gene_type:complete
MGIWNKFVSFLIGDPVEPSGVRARDSKGRYKADDKSTPNVNEAYKDGKSPKKKATKKAPAKRGRGRPKGSKNKPKK